MLPKAVISLSVATTSRQGNTSMAKSLDANSQVVTKG